MALFRAALALTASSALAAPAGPTPQVPEGGTAPGAYPNTSVSGLNVVALGSTTFNSSVDVPRFDGQGPIPWSLNRYNRGDFALRLSPANPTAALGSLGRGFSEFADTAVTQAANQAWRPAPTRGLVMVSARQNGPIDWNDGEGAFFPTVAISPSSSGPGFNVIDGSYGNGNLDINTGRAGTHSSSPEANFPFSAAWFPYDQGWLGGEAAGPGAEGQSAWTNPQAHAAGLSAGVVKWPDFPTGSGTFGGLAEVRLPGVNALNDGLLFAISADGGSDVNVVGVDPLDGGLGWQVVVREDSATDAETLASAGQSEFQFVYVPLNTSRLVGGHINGATGAKRIAAGDFTVTRTATGTYEVTIPGKTGADGMLLLQVADRETGTSQPLASRAFLSYQFANGKFTVQSRSTTTDTTADLVDASFYVAWVDFTNPLAMPEGPRLRSVGPVASNTEELPLREAGVAASIHVSEILVVSIDLNNTGGYTDPITGAAATSAMVGQFHDALTLQPIGDRFFIFANTVGQLSRTDVEYNPVSRQYVVASTARAYNAASKDVVLLALVNPSAELTRVAKVIAHDETTEESYDDVGLAVSPVNGNIFLTAERKVTGEGESTVGALYSATGTLLTPPATRVDPLQGPGDEDDPDAAYLGSLNAFLYYSNTDNSNGSTGVLSNRVVGSVIDSTPGPGGTLVVRTEQKLGDGLPAGPEGHPFAIQNPFNGQIVTAYDAGNNTSAGDISYYSIGGAPGYAFTEASPEVPYLRGAPGTPFRHQHPQLAADPASGTLLLSLNASASDLGLPDAYAFWVLGPDGKPLPGQLPAPWLLADAPGTVSNSANYHALTYSAFAKSYIAAFNAGNGVTYLASLEVTSNHLPVATPPTLVITRGAADVRLTWPASSTGFVLESSTALSGPWGAAGLVGSVEAGQNVVVAVPSADRTYFRLSKP